ncbi:MAG: LptA/OstA family protein [Candidatus Firestonebacteria bacterium]
MQKNKIIYIIAPLFSVVILLLFSLGIYSQETEITVDAPLSITANKVEGNQKEKMVTYTGNVILKHSKSTVKSDIMKAYTENEKVVCDGNVYFINTKDKITIRSGHLEYYKQTKYAYVTENPVLVKKDKDNSETKVVSKEMEMFENDRIANAKGDVKITRKDIIATCQLATYYSKEEKILLTGDPVAIQKKNTFRGEKIWIYPKNNKLVLENKVDSAVYLEEKKEEGEK